MSSKMHTMAHRTLVAALVVACIGPGATHRGALTRSSCDNDFGSSAAALAISDPTISWSFSHYVDCTQRAVWMKFTNPSADFKFYVGVGIPPMPRFKDLLADAVIIGPGLPQLSEAEQASLPAEVRNDPAWSSDMGAIIRRSPADQSTCAHLGQTMTNSSSIVDDRCNFFEPYGQTNSWRVLDADDESIPQSGQVYYVAVWFQQPTSGKLGIAMGTWEENFWSAQTIITPTCTRDMDDFSEKLGAQTDFFPVAVCSGGVSVGGATTVAKSCDLGSVCDSADSGICSGSDYKVQMGCGGARCPAAVKLWDEVNMNMHKGMAINFTGDAKVDFVRGMIPHHQGAVDMCAMLVLNITCLTWEDSDKLEGLVHFCNHVNLEQTRELAGMLNWLQSKKIEATHSCMDANGGADMQNMNAMNHADHMSDGCGETSDLSSMAFMDANRNMHAGMAIDFSCEHDVDFVRSMMPHHAGAVAMCTILDNFTQVAPDPFLTELCGNITRLQRAEIAWMSKWLAERKHNASAPCQTCADDVATQPEMPCEDMLPSTSFCHLLGGDLMCKCDSAIQQNACGTMPEINGFAVMNVSAQCERSCGHCPDERPPLFHVTACTEGMNHGGHGMTDVSAAQRRNAVIATVAASIFHVSLSAL